MSTSYSPGSTCSSQRDKSFWISTFSSFGSSFLLLSIISLMIYFSLWRTKENNRSTVKNFTHLGFISSIFLKSIGFCSAGILLRFQNVNWEYISPIILDIPQASITFGFSLILMMYCLSCGRLLAKQTEDKVNKVIYSIPILSGIFLFGTIVLTSLYYAFQKSSLFNINLWLSLIRDLIVAISFIVLLCLIKKLRVVPPNQSNTSDKNQTILSFIILSCMILRGISYIIDNYVFSPSFTHDQNSRCGISSLIYFVFQTLICEVLPVICILLLQGIMSTLPSYDSIE